MVVDDNPGDAQLILSHLRHGVDPLPDANPYIASTASSLDDAIAAASQVAPDVVLLDLGMGPTTGLDTLFEWLSHVPQVPVIVVTGRLDDALGVQAVRAGAQDFLRKDELNARSLRRAIRYALERQDLTRELLRADARLSAVATHAPDIVFACDATGCVHVARTNGADVDHRPRHLRDYVDPRDLEQLLLTLAKVYNEQSARRVAVRVPGSEGTTWFEFHIGPMPDTAETDQFIVIARDITKHKTTQEHLEGNLEQIQRQQRFRERLLSTITHDLAQPLTPVRTYHSLLSGHINTHFKKDHDAPVPENWRKALLLMERNVEQLIRLTGDLGDLGRVMARNPTLFPAEADLAELTRDAVDAFANEAARKGAELLHRADDNVTLVCDPQRVTQILFNLITNAIKFCSEGNTIQVVAEQDHHMAVIQVIDDGPGIPCHELDRIFEPFEQLEGMGPEGHKGSGLGLYIARGYAIAHGGTLFARSKGRGHGTTFEVRLPLRTVDAISASGAST